jgi:hypothetical protein
MVCKATTWLGTPRLEMKPGEHLVVVGDDSTGVLLRSAGLIVRDAIAIVLPGPTVVTAWLAREPMKGTLIQNTLQHGACCINLDGCRVATAGEVISNHARSASAAKSKGIYGDSRAQETHVTEGQRLGRWPSNIVLVHEQTCGDSRCESTCPVTLLNQQSGELRTNPGMITAAIASMECHGGSGGTRTVAADASGTARFYPQFASLNEAVEWLQRLVS